jgi:hypothetical protein
MADTEYQEPLNILEQKKEFERLLDSPAWRILMREVQEQVDHFQRTILFAPIEGEADIFKQERMKGQLEGRLSLEHLVRTKMEQLTYDHARAQEAKNADE